jgi:cell division protein FtsW
MTTAKHKKSKTKKSKISVSNQSNYYWLLGTIYILVLFGLVMILSASSVRAYNSMGDSYYYIKKQLVALGLGSTLLLLCYLFPIKRLQAFSKVAIVASIALLAAVLFPGVGKEVDGASRWLALGSFRLQPSEFAKIAVIMFTADYLSRHKRGLKHLADLQKYAIALGIIIALVMIQPDMGTTITICLSALSMLFIYGLNLRYIMGIILSGGVVGALLIYIEPYRFSRLMAFVDPSKDPTGAGWQIKQSMIAFGSGGLLGVGLGMSGQKHYYLPAAHTDFIFAIIGEELGLIGTLFVLSLFTIFAYYGMRVSLSSKNRYAQMLGSGITASIVMQAIVNMGAVTGILPVTGIPMPFISYGGSSLIVNLIAVGMLMRIAKENKQHRAHSASEKSDEQRRSNNKVYVLDEESNNRGSSRGKHRKKKPAAKRKTAAKSGSREKVLKLVSTADDDLKHPRRKRPDARQAIVGARKRQTNESNNKRRRDSGSRVSGSSSSQSVGKSKR